VWWGLACALFAAAAFGAASVLQAIASRATGRGSRVVDPWLLVRVLRQWRFVAGVGLDALGALAQLLALRVLPLFVVQTALAASLAVTAILVRLLGTVLGRPNDPGYGRVLVYDIKSGSLKPVARPNTTPPLRPGEWESSGVINAQTFLGEGWWLMDIQAHRQLAPQPGVSLLPNSSIGEDGQLLAVYIPNT